MGLLDGQNLRLANHKSFGDSPQGLEDIRPINVVVGRNNIGKTAFLDSLEFACQTESRKRRGASAKLFYKFRLDETLAKEIFRENVQKTNIGNLWTSVGRKLVGKEMEVDLAASPRVIANLAELLPGLAPETDYAIHALRDEFVGLARLFKDPFSMATFARLAADRNIVVESQRDALGIASDGLGITSSIEKIYNNAAEKSEIVSVGLLGAINKITAPDQNFVAITPRRLSNSDWEIFLQEKQGESLALSSCGSGLKTIILVAAFFTILPYIHKNDLSSFVICIEEPENSLHPASQRRLMAFVREMAISHKASIFLSTHSSVVIDFFSKDENAQILHVTKSNGCSQVRKVRTYYDNKGVLDDLDVRASDLLQSNCIVWVEGPSDRRYVNRWISLWSNESLVEGVHYQCAFYGGRLLAHLSGTNLHSQDIQSAVNLLRINRNAIVIIDSDRDKSDCSLNSTKRRIIDEIEETGGASFVTAGREIENYIPFEALQAYVADAQRPIERFEKMENYLESQGGKGCGAKYARNKVIFAETILPFVTLETAARVFDLDEKVSQLVKLIRKWNS